MSERKQRIGENEALFRSVNEQVQALEESFSAPTEIMHALCECGVQTCMERIELRPAEYERVRSNALHFVVKPGHVFEDTESVIEQAHGYWIVQKHPGLPAQIAQATDPR